MKQDKWTKFLLLWIAFMLTVIAFKPLLEIPIAQAKESVSQSESPVIELKEPVIVEFRKPIEVRIVDIKTVWPTEVKIKDEVKVGGELKLKN
jgi:hypothetical protein